MHYDFADKKPKPMRRSHSLPVMKSEFLEKTHGLVEISQFAEKLLRNGLQASHGSLLHDGRGSCKPCAWNWKPSGCSKGKLCKFCHTCDADQIKRKKKQRIAQLKNEKKLALMLTEQTLKLQGDENEKSDRSDKSNRGSSDGRLQRDTSENSSHGRRSRSRKSTHSQKDAWKHFKFLKNQGNDSQTWIFSPCDQNEISGDSGSQSP